MTHARKPTTNGIEILNRTFYEDQPERQAQLEQARLEDEIGRKILALREQAGLTQSQLARLLAVRAQFIADLEEAALETNYLLWLQRVATVLRKRVEIRCVPFRRQLEPA
jgi:ribosome-binding protein aMBF1 (putative translation factor)